MAVATESEQAGPGAKHNVQAARAAYYDKISKFHMAPLWEVLKDLVTPEPKTQVQPAAWKFSDVKRLMLEAGDVIGTEEAERRVLVLENPGMPGKSRVTNSLFAGIQLILPGEIADVHRHSASAIRFVLEGEGAYTAVEGEKTMMKHGDFIITANWALANDLLLRMAALALIYLLINFDLKRVGRIFFSAGLILVLFIITLINFLGILSVNLAILNIMPFPALDGGRLFFILIESISSVKLIKLFETLLLIFPSPVNDGTYSPFVANLIGSGKSVPNLSFIFLAISRATSKWGS